MNDFHSSASPFSRSKPGSHGTGESHAPTRTIAEVARVFLNGARQTPVNGAPARTPPGAGSRTVTSSVPSRTKVAPVRKKEEPSLDTLIVAAAPYESGLSQLHAVAAALAEEQATTVCVLSIQNDTFSASVFGAESADDVPHVQMGGGAIDLAVARILNALRPAVGMWMVLAPNADHPALRRLLPAAKSWLFTTGTSDESVVYTYQQMKTMLPNAPAHLNPSLFVLSNHAAEARAVHGRLGLALNKFLQRELSMAGIAGVTKPRGDSFQTISLALKHGHSPAAPSELVSAQSVVWSAVLDELLPIAGEDAEMVEDEELLGNRAESAAVAAAAGGGKGPMIIPPASGSTEGIPPTQLMESAFTKMQSNVSSLSHELGDQPVGRSTAGESQRSRNQEMPEDTLGSVLDFEERAALTAEFPVTAAPVVPPARTMPKPPVEAPILPAPPVVASPKSPSVLASTAQLIAAPIAPVDRLTLRAYPFPGMDARNPLIQWTVTLRAFAELMPNATRLEVAAPQAWAIYSAFALDDAGTLHVWSLYQNNIAPFALREWASQHRTMLMLGHTDHPIDQERQVMLHLVLPIDSPANDPALRPFLTAPTPDVFIYRLRAVEFNAQLAMVVLPLG